MALRLQQSGEEVSLVVLDSRPPGVVQSARLPSDAELRAAFEEGIAVFGNSFTAGFGRVLTSETEKDRLFGVWRAHLAALLSYRPAATFRGSIGVVVAADPAPFETSVLSGLATIPIAEGWHAVSTRPSAVRVVPGNHFTLVAAAQAGAVGQAIRELLPWS
jgi:thioesterase domain-containing protein